MERWKSGSGTAHASGTPVSPDERTCEPDGRGKLPVNYLRYELYNGEKRKAAYRNSQTVGRALDKGTAGNAAECARSRREAENGRGNVLKHHGYNLEHNFGHGKEHANGLLCPLNLLAFLFHGIRALAKDEYRKAKAPFGGKEGFFWALRSETARYFHASWHGLFLTVSGNARAVEFGIAHRP
jgi:hypothetical protein